MEPSGEIYSGDVVALQQRDRVARGATVDQSNLTAMPLIIYKLRRFSSLPNEDPTGVRNKLLHGRDPCGLAQHHQCRSKTQFGEDEQPGGEAMSYDNARSVVSLFFNI
jgi:hypothetical protein